MRLRVWFPMLLLALLAACGTPTLPPNAVHFTIAGSTAMTPLLSELAEAYSIHFAQVSISVEGGGSRLGLKRAQEDEVALGASSWLPAKDKASAWSAPVAIDGIALIVHPDNDLSGLTLAQLREIFSGRLWNWVDLGGRGEVQVISREDGSGTRAAFEAQVMEGQRVTPTALVMPGKSAVIDYIAAHPEAIGYVSAGYLKDNVKVLAIEGVLPAAENITDGSYHLVRPFFLIASKEPTGAARSFVDFVVGAEGQSIVGQYYGRVR